MVTYNLEGLSKEYFAGFWQRTIAFLIDYLIVWTGATALGLTINMVQPATVHVHEFPVGINSTKTIRQEVQHISEDGKYFLVVSTLQEKSDFLGITNYYLMKTTFDADENGNQTSSVGFWTTIAYDIENEQPLEYGLLSTEYFLWVFLIVYVSVMDSSIFSSTFGKKVMNIIVLHESGQQTSLGKAVLRSFLRLFSIAILFIGVVIIPFDGQRRSLHDRLLRTRVVKKGHFQAV